MSTFRDPDGALASWIGGGDVSSEEAGRIMAWFMTRYQAEGACSDAIRLAAAFMYLGGALHAEGRDSWREPLTFALDMWQTLADAFEAEIHAEQIGERVVLLPFSAVFYAGTLAKQLGQLDYFEAARARMRELLSGDQLAPAERQNLHDIFGEWSDA